MFLSQSPDFRTTEVLWKDTEKTVHVRKPTTISEEILKNGLKSFQAAIDD